MTLTLHHVNVCSPDVPELERFYHDVLGLPRETNTAELPRLDVKNYAGPVAFMTDGAVQFHLAKQDLTFAKRAGHAINPLVTGHIAFRTDDMDDVLRRLDAAGVPYSDYGNWAVDGWRQVFFADPSGMIVEVHQAPKPAKT
jgi:catechol 2,3-dioxygenase-like lactoylglutathione lyase family enzyme